MKIDVSETKDGREEALVWLDEDEFTTLADAADSRARNLIVRLGGRGGLRAAEVTKVCAGHIKDVESDVEGVEDYKLLYIPDAKDTTGDGGKDRHTAIPSGLARDLTYYAMQNDVDKQEPLFDVTETTIRNRVGYVAESAAEKTGNDDYLYVSSHDLRRFFATHLLQRKRVDINIVQSLGGWEKRAHLEPYLKEPTPENIVEELSERGV